MTTRSEPQGDPNQQAQDDRGPLGQPIPVPSKLEGGSTKREELICGPREAAYRFRYEGLKLLLRAQDHYFFLPEAWSPSQGAAIVIPQSDAVRLEFFVASPSDLPASSAC
jgi:hypothetical protein